MRNLGAGFAGRLGFQALKKVAEIVSLPIMGNIFPFLLIPTASRQDDILLGFAFETSEHEQKEE